MKKTLLLLAVSTLLFSLQKSTAQNAQFTEGDRSVAIIVNPIFSYVGNIFDQDTYNDLDLNSAGMIFRKFKSPTQANRFQFNLNMNSSTQGNPGYYPTRTSTYVNLGFDYGQEYRKSFTNLSIYGGWFTGLYYYHQAVAFNYDDSPPNNFTRIIESNYGDNVALNLGGFLGAEYYFSEHFFVGVEVELRGYVAYTFNESETIENFQFTGSGYVSTTETNSMDNSFNFRVSSNNPVLFTAGIKF